MPGFTTPTPKFTFQSILFKEYIIKLIDLIVFNWIVLSIMNETTNLRESRLRSVLKGLTWRVLATGTTILIALIVTGDIKPALQIGAVEFVAKFVVYYLHERAWAQAPLGSVRRQFAVEKELDPESPAEAA